MNSSSEEFQKIENAMSASMSPVFEATAETEKIDSVVPVTKDKLFSYLQAGSYKNFAATESSRHPTRGPHTKIGWPVRVFLGPKIDASLKAGNASHPIGSSIVKELYDASGKFQGWAVMVKTSADSEGGKGWFWYEITSTTDGAKPIASGKPNVQTICYVQNLVGKIERPKYLGVGAFGN